MKVSRNYELETKILLYFQNRKPFDKKYLVAFFSIVGVSAVLSGMLYYLTVPSILKKTAEISYSQALKDFDSSWKEKIISDQSLTNKVCHAWWFGMTSKDRKLEIPRKK